MVFIRNIISTIRWGGYGIIVFLIMFILFFVPIFRVTLQLDIDSDILLMTLSILSGVLIRQLRYKLRLGNFFKMLFMINQLKEFDDKTNKIKIRESLGEGICYILEFAIKHNTDIRWSNLSIDKIKYEIDNDGPYVFSILGIGKYFNIKIENEDINSIPRIEDQNFQIINSTIKNLKGIRHVSQLHLKSSQIDNLGDVESIHELIMEKSNIGSYNNLKSIYKDPSIDDKKYKEKILKSVTILEEKYKYNDYDDYYDGI